MNTENKKYNLEKQWQLVNFCEFDKYATKSYCAIHNVDESKNLGDITKVDETDKKYNLEKQWQLVNFCEFDKYATKSYCAIHNVDESKNLGDITKVDETDLDDFNMICGGSPCFVAGTKVYTRNGYKNIEDVRVGDMVLTHNNRYMPVVNIGGEKNQTIYSLKVQGFLPTECTDYHPFYCKKDKNSDPEKIKLKDLKKGYYLGSHINIESKNVFNLTNEDCWILGRYVADGHIRKDKRKNRINSYQYQCILSIGENKLDDLRKIIKEHNYSCFKHTESVYRVVFSSMNLVNFIIDNNFGRNAYEKNIPSFILDLPKDKLKSFLDGYMAGDGCEINGKYQATTISKKLAMSLCLAIQKVYRVGCRIYFDKRPETYKIKGRIVNQKDTYMIRFMRESQKQLWFIKDNIVWYPIKEIIDTGKIENVFNIEVEEDHTYTANNIITFNCQDFSVAGKQKGSVWTCQDCGHEYNPLTVHWSKRDTCPNCGSENIEKTRSSLLVEYLRVVRANKPNFGIYENVKNIVGKQFKDTTFKLFTDELEEYGYNVYWKVLNAKNYGIPQNRERVYLIFIKKDLDNGKFKFPEPFDNGLRLKDLLEDEVDEKFYISDEKVERFITNLNNKNSLLYDPCQVKREGKSREYSEYAPTLTSRDYKDPRLVNENAVKQVGNISDCNGNWNNPQVGRVYDVSGCSPTLNTCSGGGHEPKVVTGIDKSYNNPKLIEIANCITSREDRGVSNRESEGTAVLKIGNINPSGNGMNGSVYSENGLSPTLTTNKGEGSKVAIKQATKQGYIECEIGGVADLSYPDSKTRRGRVQDKGNTCPTITATETGICRIEPKERFFKQAIETLNENDCEYGNTINAFNKYVDKSGYSPTLTTRPEGFKTAILPVTDNIRIRKLTPRETFRLMGFSDENFNAAQKAGISNSQLYKQAGNSIVVDVLYYIYVELYKAMPYLFDNLKLSSFFSGIGAFEIALDRLYEGINSGNFINPQTE